MIMSSFKFKENDEEMCIIDLGLKEIIDRDSFSGIFAIDNNNGTLND